MYTVSLNFQPLSEKQDILSTTLGSGVWGGCMGGGGGEPSFVPFSDSPNSQHLLFICYDLKGRYLIHYSKSEGNSRTPYFVIIFQNREVQVWHIFLNRGAHRSSKPLHLLRDERPSHFLKSFRLCPMWRFEYRFIHRWLYSHCECLPLMHEYMSCKSSG